MNIPLLSKYYWISLRQFGQFKSLWCVREKYRSRTPVRVSRKNHGDTSFAILTLSIWCTWAKKFWKHALFWLFPMGIR